MKTRSISKLPVLRSLTNPVRPAKPFTRPVDAKHVAALLNEVLAFQVANRGTDCAFYRCYTYGAGSMPKWVEQAERTLATLKKQL